MKVAFFLLTYAFAQAISAGSQKGTSGQAYERYLADLKSITAVAEAVSDDGHWPYFRSEKVRQLYASSSQHRLLALKVLADANAPNDVKMLAIWLQQCLPLAEYLDFSKEALALQRRGILEESLLGVAIDPGEEWGTRFALEYRRAEIAAFLGEVARDPATSVDMRERIADILSGDRASYVIDAQAADGPLPRLKCMVVGSDASKGE